MNPTACISTRARLFLWKRWDQTQSFAIDSSGAALTLPHHPILDPARISASDSSSNLSPDQCVG
jgi:hypothetical protein